MNTPKTISEVLKEFDEEFVVDVHGGLALNKTTTNANVLVIVKIFIRQSIKEILNSITLEEIDGLKAPHDKFNFSDDYYKGYNQKTREIKELLNKIRL